MKILVIEDEELVRSVVVRILRGDWHDVFAAATHDEAVDLLEDEYDLVISDYFLDRGRTVLDLVDRVRPEAPLIVMSGSESEFPPRLKERIAGFIAKPFEMRDLLRAIEEATS